MMRTTMIAALAFSVMGCKNNQKNVPQDSGTGDTAPFDVDQDSDGQDPPADSQGEDDAPADFQDEDSVPPPPVEWYCRACTWDSECGPGGECVDHGPGDWSCATSCDGDDGCPGGAQCLARPDGESRCMPNTGACLYDPLGSACPAWGCTGRENLCSDPGGATGYCTHGCESRADCDVGYNRCEDRGDGLLVCLADLPSPFERCGTMEHDDGIGSPCGSSTCADPVFVCSDSLSDDIPAFCTIACASDTQCGPAGRCVALEGTDGTSRHCVPDECTCLGIVPGSMLDTALAATGLTRCDLGWPEQSVTPAEPELTHDRFRLPWFDDVHDDWLRGGVPLAGQLESRLDAAVSSGYAQVVIEASRMAGHPIAGGDPVFTPDATEPLVASVIAIIEQKGGTADVDAIRADSADVPAQLQQGAAIVLLAAAEGIAARQRAVEGTIGADETQMRLFFMKTPGFVNPMAGTALDPRNRQVQDLLVGDFGYEEVYQAGFGIARAVEQAGFDSMTLPAESFSFDQATGAGRIIIADGSDHEHGGALACEDILLFIDVGGNDVYRVSAGGNSSVGNPVSIAIDMGGEDTYGYVEVPGPFDSGRLVSDAGGRASAPNLPFSLSDTARQGSGRMGIGMLFDLGEDPDDYTSLRMSQGFGSLGLGLLWDEGGDDTYRCEASCQGAGIFGLGIMVDRGAGTDTHESYHVSQGFAYSGAVGVLHDGGGQDSYACDKDDVLYESAQDSLSNSSLCQGMGFGRRADTWLGGDGVFMSGGLGVLRDLDGDDTYEAAVFGQGCGYWFGLGALLDGGGADLYDARWYVQGAGAHYANGLLHDASGNDRYNETEDRRLNVTLGGGHDYSIAFLLDDAGDDHYFAPNLSFGAGNDDGFGLFLDREGTDEYECSSNFSFGNAVETSRVLPLSVGVFLDAGGADTYVRPDTTLTTNDGAWTQTMSGGSSEHGAGMDVDTGGVPGI